MLREFLAENHVLVSGAIGAAVAGGLSRMALSSKARRAEKHGSNWRYLDPGIAGKLTAVLMLPIAGFIDYAAMNASPDQTGIALALAGSLTAASLLVFYEMFARRVRWNTTEIQSVHPFGTRSIKWNSGVTGGYYPFFMLGVVRAADGRRIWIQQFGGARLLARYGRMRERKHVLIDSLNLRPPVAGSLRELDDSKARHTITVNPSEAWTNEGMTAGTSQTMEVLDGRAILWCAGHEKEVTCGWSFTLPGPERFPCAIFNPDTRSVVLSTRSADVS